MSSWVKINIARCASDLVPTGSADSDCMSAFVSPLTPYLSYHLGLLLTNSLTKPNIHIDVITITFTPDDEIVDIREGKAKVVIATRAEIITISCL